MLDNLTSPLDLIVFNSIINLPNTFLEGNSGAVHPWFPSFFKHINTPKKPFPADEWLFELLSKLKRNIKVKD